MVRELEQLCLEERLRELGFFSPQKALGGHYCILSVLTDGLEERWRKTF